MFLSFAFVDVWYFVRFVPLFVRRLVIFLWRKRILKTLAREDVMKATIIEGIVLPFDLDMNMHMNNSKYLREMDFGRIFHIVHSGLYAAIWSEGAFMVVGAISIRYRRSLNLWDRFQLRSRILCWDDSNFYYEQRFVNKQGFVCAVALLQMAVRHTTPREILEKACLNGSPESPPIPSQVEAWREAIQRSSESLKNE